MRRRIYRELPAAPFPWSIHYPCLTTDETGALSLALGATEAQVLATVPSAFSL